jgi:2,3-dihydroxyphenylpropionate 1,2-dioxygenase
MASIVMGIGASHTTLMNTQWEEVSHLPGPRNFKQALQRAGENLLRHDPDFAIVIGSNHFRGHWLDLMPAFAIGVDEVLSSGEHGTPQGLQKCRPGEALAIAEDLIAQNFDLTTSTRLAIDHGISHAIQYLTRQGGIPVVPIMINCFAPPLPRLQRCVELGKALRGAVHRLGGDLKVAVIASGGLSHQLPFPDWRQPKSDDDAFLVDSWKNGRGDWERYEARRRAIVMSAPPRINEKFDNDFLDALCRGATQAWLTDFSEAGLVEVAGNGANELRTWLTMHAALDFEPGELLGYEPVAQWLTGMAVFQCQPT